VNYTQLHLQIPFKGPVNRRFLQKLSRLAYLLNDFYCYLCYFRIDFLSLIGSPHPAFLTDHQPNIDEKKRLPRTLTWTKLQWVAPRWNEGRTVNSSTHYLRNNRSSDGAIPVLPKLASRHRLPQRVQLVGWNLVTSFESQKRSLVARSSAEAEYRADAKAPGRDFPL